MTEPRIAVLLPCYNEEAAIAQTVAGFLGLAEVFPPALHDDAGFAADLSAALSGLVRDGARATAADRISA